MKKILALFLLSIISTNTMAQTAQDIEFENQSLTAQNNSYDFKIIDKENELKNARKKYEQLQTQRRLSEEACKSISESDLNLMAGLSGGTILLSGADTAIGTVGIIKNAKESQNNTTHEDGEEDNNDINLQKTSTASKIAKIGTTALSAGSTVTSAIALSKVNGLKNDIEKCIDSFK